MKTAGHVDISFVNKFLKNILIYKGKYLRKAYKIFEYLAYGVLPNVK